MKALFKKAWKDPVGSKVIAAAIIAVLSSLYLSLSGNWGIVYSPVKRAILYDLVLPVWAILLVCSTCILAPFIFLRWRKCPNTEIESEEKKDEYINLLGLRWRWIDGIFGIDNIRSFCPECDLEVSPQRVRRFQKPDAYGYKCDSCEWQSELSRNDPYKNVDLVKREIEKQKRKNVT